ncbi:molybdenum cofactor synthesis domain-containing protein [Microbacterium sp. SORGH_AS 505]|uniref:MogA/MoaB family molybdenum cofactor biosynthesis protein n=1 Tax=Microbacterium sp. SORGH_AS_0505 TaxID=3041770 RepID=UPI0027825EDB|nr:MogA/MoaB family molybdenum cofactor biosynthesis protein [Microbacterium sp. SORGH_AS_0505]MDQ1126799.1 molybdenum cofactor synthesis domain-containing protein [Microbacterium sp. SORGH_AS_0505]
MTSLRSVVITVSDRSASGEREDRGGPLAVQLLEAAGIEIAGLEVVPDGADSVEAALRRALATRAQLIVTTGGTGVGPRDQTPEGTERVVTRSLPGIAEELRRVGLTDTPLSVISRGVAGVVDPEGALVVNLPGSPRAVSSGIPVIVSVATHVVDQVRGGDHS